MTASGWHRKKPTAASRARAAQYASPEHQAIRKQRVATSTPLTPCGYCDKPLGPNTRDWHVPHNPDRTYAPGLWHATCNRKEAASRGARAANAKRQGWKPPAHRPTYVPRNWG